MGAVRQALPIPQRVMAVVLSVLFVFCPFAAYAAGESDTAADPVLLPIIMYHEVKPNKSGKDAIQPWEFEADLKWLADNGYTTIVMADLIAYVRDGTPLPEKPIILSFDDGYYNNYVYVLPLLQQYSARIVLSLLGRNTDDFTEWPSESIDYAHVTWDQLNEMLDTGLVEVQNHSYNLHAYTSERHGCIQNPGESDAAYTQLLRADLQRLQDEIADHASVIRVHPRPVGVEDPHDLDRQIALETVGVEQRFGAALPFIVAGTQPDRIHVAPVLLHLRVDVGVAVNLAG